ncbi:hypothetical protein CLOP_g6660 [Closterium sp. NIES-67]|nr:hypothetical protein CLOP_g6660 [Closterium sp. NIES-67]
MSAVPRESVQVAAHSIGIANLGDDVAAALAPDVEYRMREIIQEAVKCMRHGKRTTLTTADIAAALSLRNVEPLFGFASADSMRFRRAMGHSDVFFLHDQPVDLRQVFEAPLPPASQDVSVAAHWLAVEGVQPATPENTPPAAMPPSAAVKAEAGRTGDASAQRGAAGPGRVEVVEVKMPVKHVLSKELQLYFERVTELLLLTARSTPPATSAATPPAQQQQQQQQQQSLLSHALRSVALDAGLHPLLPYFVHFIADEVMRSLDDCPLLFSLMRLVRALLLNPHLHMEPYVCATSPDYGVALVVGFAKAFAK